jgi:succinate-semialdehyde dehydrogenase/glutarate-semialdehyde dehydrogenase
MTYPHTQLFINGQWQDAADGKTLAVFNPATGQEIGRVAHAGKPDLDRALEAAAKGFRDLARHDRRRAQQDHAQGGRR